MSKERGGQAETLLDLLRRIDELSPRHPVRRSLVDGAAGLFGVSRSMVSRARAPRQHRPRGRRRTDRGEPRTSILVSHSLAACYLRCSRHRSPRHFRNGGGKHDTIHAGWWPCVLQQPRARPANRTTPSGDGVSVITAFREPSGYLRRPRRAAAPIIKRRRAGRGRVPPRQDARQCAEMADGSRQMKPP